MIEKARRYRKIIESLAGYLDDETAVKSVDLFPHWNEETVYSVKDRVQYNGLLYECLQAHQSQAAWNPADATSIWARVLIPDPSVIPEWEQPISTNPYMAGDKVRHNDKIWVSDIDNNIWEPGVYGWTETAN